MKCNICGAELTKETMKTFKDIPLCSHCFDTEIVYCHCCGEQIWRSEAEGNINLILCERCFDNNYSYCEDCGSLIHNSNAYYFDDSDYPYCQSCFEELQDKPIKEYSYKPEPIFYGSGNLFMGVELEIDEGGENNDNAESILGIGNFPEERIYCKHDGSIEDGFEIVSHPMTPEYHLNTMNWKEILTKAIDMGYRSHQAGTCGLHIHVNRDAFGGDIDEQEKKIARIVYFVEKHWDKLLNFSRRSEDAMNRWAARYGISHNTEDTYIKAKQKGMGRYVAINLTNYSTIEFRLFRGTLRYETFAATIQLVERICNLATKITDKEMEELTWEKFIDSIETDKKELIDYLKIRRLYKEE